MADGSSQTPSELWQFLAFRIDARLYAFPADDVAEVLRTPRFARVPQSPASLLGIANLRGTVLPLVSVRGLLGLAESPVEDSRAIVLAGRTPCVLTVDVLIALVTVESGRIETKAAEVSADRGEQITGVFHVDGLGAVKILDVRSLLDKTFTRRLERKNRSAVRSADTQSEGPDQHLETEAFVTFDVAEQEFALALSSVKEIVPAPTAITPLPNAEATLIGMIEFRQHLLPVFSLRILLGFPPAGESEGREKIVVATIGKTVVGLLADRARAVVRADLSQVDPLPAVLATRSGDEAQIKAIYRGESGRRLISILAPEKLFREDVMQRLGSQDESASRDAPMRSADQQFLVFSLGDDEFGLPIEAVDEVARVPEQITRVPKTPKFLEGVINLRGDVLPVVDQRRRFDMPKAEDNAARRLIVVRSERHRAGLIVDDVSEVLRCAASAIEPPPDLTSDIATLVRGVINLEDQRRIVLLLDPSELLTRTERGLLDTFARNTKAAS